MIVILREISRTFRSVTVLSDALSTQTFFINVHLLRAVIGDNPRHNGKHMVDNWPLFVHLIKPPEVVEQAPAHLAKLAEEVCRIGEADEVPIIFSMSDAATIIDAVPLAAVLLEYPVAYVPASAQQTSFLEGATLDVYECILTWTPAGAYPAGLQRGKHTLLKFSCPNTIGTTHPELSSDRLARRLKSRFQPRLQQIGFSCALSVIHTTETHDRVAL